MSGWIQAAMQQNTIAGHMFTAQDPHYSLGYFDHFHHNFLKFVSLFAKYIFLFVLNQD